MRFLRYLVLALIALFLVALATSNRQPVTLRLLSDELAAQVGIPAILNAVSMPLFMVIAFGIGIGVLLGFVAEWLREHKFRAEARQKRREAAVLSNELKKAKIDKAQGDDVLALLDDAGPAR